MKKNEQIWVEEVLNSTEGMVPARPRAELYTGIKNRLGKVLPGGRRISLGLMSAAAASLLLLFALNIKVVSNYIRAERVEVQEEPGAMEDLIEYYELGSNTIGL